MTLDQFTAKLETLDDAALVRLRDKLVKPKAADLATLVTREITARRAAAAAEGELMQALNLIAARLLAAGDTHEPAEHELAAARLWFAGEAPPRRIERRRYVPEQPSPPMRWPGLAARRARVEAESSPAPSPARRPTPPQPEQPPSYHGKLFHSPSGATARERDDVVWLTGE